MGIFWRKIYMKKIGVYVLGMYVLVIIIFFSLNFLIGQEKKGKSPEELKQEFETKLATNIKKVSDKHTELGNTFNDYKMYLIAKDEYKRALTVSPENEKAINKYNETSIKNLTARILYPISYPTDFCRSISPTGIAPARASN